MKKRIDFVSNSSSSSYIVIANSGNPCIRECGTYNAENNWPNTFYFPSKKYGCKEFGWDDVYYVTFESKLNFISIQLLYLFCEEQRIKLKIDKSKKLPLKGYKSFDEYYALVKKVCKDRFNFNYVLDDSFIHYGIEYCQYPHVDGCYIDHQSDLFETPRNISMLENEETLYNFLHYDDSMIVGGNDNGE